MKYEWKCFSGENSGKPYKQYYLNTPLGCVTNEDEGSATTHHGLNLTEDGEWIPAPGFGGDHKAPIRIYQDCTGAWNASNDLTGISGRADTPIEALGNSMLQRVQCTDDAGTLCFEPASGASDEQSHNRLERVEKAEAQPEAVQEECEALEHRLDRANRTLNAIVEWAREGASPYHRDAILSILRGES